MSRWMKKGSSAKKAGQSPAPKEGASMPLSSKASTPRPNNLNSRRISASFETEIETTPTLKRSAPSEIVELDNFSSKRIKKESKFEADVNVDTLDFLQGVEAPPKAQKARKVRRVVEYSDDDEDYIVEDDDDDKPPSSLRKDADDDVKMEDTADGFPFSDFTHSKDATPAVIPGHLEKQQTKARKQLKNNAMSGPKDDTLSTDWAVKNPWAVDIRDRNGKRPGEDGYDKTTLYVPGHAFQKGSKLTPFQMQFWGIKKDNYDVIIFFVSYPHIISANRNEN